MSVDGGGYGTGVPGEALGQERFPRCPVEVLRITGNEQKGSRPVINHPSNVLRQSNEVFHVDRVHRLCGDPSCLSQLHEHGHGSLVIGELGDRGYVTTQSICLIVIIDKNCPLSS